MFLYIENLGDIQVVDALADSFAQVKKKQTITTQYYQITKIHHISTALLSVVDQRSEYLHKTYQRNQQMLFLKTHFIPMKSFDRMLFL